MLVSDVRTRVEIKTGLSGLELGVFIQMFYQLPADILGFAPQAR